MRTTDGQVRKLMEEMAKHGEVGQAAMRAGVDRQTARKYVKAGKLPSAMAAPGTWRTRSDPFAEVWDVLVAMLEQTPRLEAKTQFELLCDQHPGRYEPGQLRTLQRRVRQWRARSGPLREVMFTQIHRPGEACQVDFTEVVSLRITIAGEALRAPALRVHAAVLQLAVGDGVPVRVACGAEEGHPSRAVPARRRPAVQPDGQLDGGNPPDPQ